MNQDDLYAIMLQTDIVTLKNICLTSKYNLCYNPHFWKDYFNHHGLQFKGAHLSEWIGEYIEQLAVKNRNIIWDLINRGGVEIPLTLQLINDIKRLFPLHIKSIMNIYHGNIIYADALNIHYNYERYILAYYKNNVLLHSLSLTKQFINNIIYYLLTTFPNIRFK